MMSPSIKGLFGFLVFLSLLGVTLGYDGIATMRREGMPPFNTGLYTAVWSVWPPPQEMVAWSDTTLGRIVVWSGTLTAPVLFGMALFRMRWWLLGLGGMTVWSLALAGFGIWIWIHSRLH